jgi:multidrug efflux pump subunit AcrB
MKNIAQFFVDRPIMAAVLSLIFVIAGSIAVFKLPSKACCIRLRRRPATAR